MLKYSDRPIADIAQYMGIRSQSDFSMKFKRFMGVSPSKYRETNRSNVFT